MMKTKNLATLVILLCSFALAPSLLRADPNEWYQGRQGQWVQQQNAWRFRDTRGDEYRQYGNSWRWSNERAEQYEWFQGHRGHWIKGPNGWVFRDLHNKVYRQYGDGWRWESREANN